MKKEGDNQFKKASKSAKKGGNEKASIVASSKGMAICEYSIYRCITRSAKARPGATIVKWVRPM